MKTINKWLKKLLQAFIRVLNVKERVSIPKTLQEDRTLLKSHTKGKDVNLLLIRYAYSENSTIGQLFLNGEMFCDTLELPWKNNERRISCIPAGVYPVRVRKAKESATRKYLHLLVEEVPDRDYILFHRGNYPKDTKGCILVGKGSQQDKVNNSRLAMDLLMKEIIHLGGEKINLIIKNR